MWAYHTYNIQANEEIIQSPFHAQHSFSKPKSKESNKNKITKNPNKHGYFISINTYDCLLFLGRGRTTYQDPQFLERKRKRRSPLLEFDNPDPWLEFLPSEF